MIKMIVIGYLLLLLGFIGGAFLITIVIRYNGDDLKISKTGCMIGLLILSPILILFKPTKFFKFWADFIEDTGCFKCLKR